MVIGSDLDGRKDVPEMWIGEHETAKFRLVVLNELRNRGVQDILICCVDNLRGFSEVIAACFPEAQVQKCVVHQIRNSVRYVSYKDVKKVLPDLEPIYTAATEPPALEVLDGFAAIWVLPAAAPDGLFPRRRREVRKTAFRPEKPKAMEAGGNGIKNLGRTGGGTEGTASGTGR
jgi:hypothetical protein